MIQDTGETVTNEVWFPRPAKPSAWDLLSTKAKFALVRRQDRLRAKERARRAVRPAVIGYRCTCHRLHPTPEARAACKAGHRRTP